MQIRPIGNNEIPFPYKKSIKVEQGMVPDERDEELNSLFPKKLRVIKVFEVQGEENNE